MQAALQRATARAAPPPPRHLATELAAERAASTRAAAATGEAARGRRGTRADGERTAALAALQGELLEATRAVALHEESARRGALLDAAGRKAAAEASASEVATTEARELAKRCARRRLS